MSAADGSVYFESLEPRLFLNAAMYGTSWVIRGDADRAQVDDEIVIRAGEDPTVLEAVVNGQVVGTAALASVRAIRIYAGRGNDHVRLDLPADAAAVRTVVYGGPGNDVLCGGVGNDRLIGQSGDDARPGGGGADRLYGGSGRNTLWGDGGDDVLIGGPAADELHGGDGNDRLYGGGGRDKLHGDDGNDRLVGGPGADELYGGAGDDRLYGGSGSDTILPGEGTDWIWGGLGKDVIYAKEGDRVFKTRADAVMGDPATSRLAVIESEEQFRQRVIDLALRRYEDLLGRTVPDYLRWWGRVLYGALDLAGGRTATAATELLAGMTGAANPGANSQGSPDYSGTNNQVEGVEEGDLVKTDGEYIYMIVGQELLIVDAFPAEEIHVVSRVALGRRTTDLFLFGDRLAVASVEWGMPWLLRPVGADTTADEDGWVEPAPPAKGPRVTFTVLDVTDRAAPRTVYETSMDGCLVDVRAVEEQIYAVVSNTLWLPEPAYQVVDDVPVPIGDVWGGPLWKQPAGQVAVLDCCAPYEGWWSRASRVYESAEQYEQRLRQMPLEDFLPAYSVTGPDGAAAAIEGLLAGPVGMYLPSDSLSDDVLTLVRLDMLAEGPEAPETTSLQGSGGQVYASTDSLYVASPNWSWEGGDEAWRNQSRIYRFDLTDDDMPLAATGIVEGVALNQFSMDQYDGQFRIATTTAGWRTSNNLFVLEQQGTDLVAVGALTGLARTESIYSVRFLGDLAYMVTFRQVDPLFVIDLADPYQPYVAGKLKVPGFSSYLHPIDETLLIGLGRDADAAGRIRGLKLSLFDVSDPARPAEPATMLLTEPAWWSGWSEALWDHHAFSYFPQQGVLALPVLDGWRGGSLRVIRVGLDGFAELGRIVAEGTLRRSLRIGDDLYAISTEQIVVADLYRPGEIVACLDLETSTEGYWVL